MVLALERKGVGVSVSSVASVLYESIEVRDLFDVSELSVPAVNGLGSEGSRLCVLYDSTSNRDKLLSFN